jgi:hypothetical protein
MVEASWVPISGISERSFMEIYIEYEDTISIGNLGKLLSSIDDMLIASTGRFISRDKEMRLALNEHKYKPFEAGLRLGLYGIEAGSWSFKSIIGGTVATTIISGLLVNGLTSLSKTIYSDFTSGFLSAQIAITEDPRNKFPFERSCQNAINAGSKLNANLVKCIISIPNGERVDIEIFKK